MSELTESGSVPASRFGHTMVMVGDTRAIVHGGSYLGEEGEYCVTNELYSFNVETRVWTRVYQRPVEKLAKIPGARAAHASCCVAELQMLMFGGSEGAKRINGGKAKSIAGVIDDGLWLLDLKSETESVWTPVPVRGPMPEARYGHIMVWHEMILKVILYGGYTGNEEMGDLWLFDLSGFDERTKTWSWQQVKMPSSVGPGPLMYHAAAICPTGFKAAGMIMVFGGRSDGQASHDVWGLSYDPSGGWMWQRAPTFGGVPHARFQHSAAFVGDKLVVLGGRTGDNFRRPLPTEVFDMATCEWRCLADCSLDRFRHASWTVGDQLMTYGGLAQNSESGFDFAGESVLMHQPFATLLSEWTTLQFATGQENVNKTLTEDGTKPADDQKKMGNLPDIMEEAPLQ